jgi:hypothetical protein
MFRHKSKGKGKKGDSWSSSQARLGTSTDLFAIMVLLNFYLHLLIHYYFTASFDIFYCCFCLQGYENRIVIRPVGESWEDINWDSVGHWTCVNQELGTFCCLLYPGMVTVASR